MNEVFISIDILEFMMNGMLKKMQALVFHLKKNLESQSFIVKQSQIMKIFQFKKKTVQTFNDQATRRFIYTCI